MSSTKSRALEAAVELLGKQGLRSLTHARVDAQAGLPRGSTSNHFRTRRALLNGVVEWLVQDLAGWDMEFDAGTATPENLVDVLCEFIEAATRGGRVRTTARYVLFLEGTHDPDIRQSLIDGRRRIEQWALVMLKALRAPDLQTAMLAILTSVEGLILYRIAIDPDADPRPALTVVVNASV